MRYSEKNKRMNETTVKTTLAAMIARIETLQEENARLTALNSECGEAVRKLVERVENLQAVNAGGAENVADRLSETAGRHARSHRSV